MLRIQKYLSVLLFMENRRIFLIQQYLNHLRSCRRFIVIYLQIDKSYTIYLKLISRFPNSQITVT